MRDFRELNEQYSDPSGLGAPQPAEPGVEPVETAQDEVWEAPAPSPVTDEAEDLERAAQAAAEAAQEAAWQAQSALLDALMERVSALDAKVTQAAESIDRRLNGVGASAEQRLSAAVSAAEMRVGQLERRLGGVQAAPAPTSERAIEPLTAKVDQLQEAQTRLEKANVDMLRDSKNFRATVQDRLQKELDGYRKMHADSAYAPILTDLANIYVNARKGIAYIADEKVRRQMTELVLEAIEELMEDQGVVIRASQVGGKRSMKACKTRKTVPTGDPELNGMVAASLNPAFILGNQVLVKESVDTYVYDPALAEPEPEEAPVEEAPAEEVPVEVPAEDIPAEDVPAEEAPAEETSAEETPAEDVPAEDVPAEDIPAEEAPVEETPTEETPSEEAPSEEAPVPDEPDAEEPLFEAE